MRVLLVIAVALAVSAPAALAQPPAPGAPGAEAVWTPADKHGFGTAHALRSPVWFTLRRAELSEVYYPTLGTPALRELRFAVSSGGRLVRESERGASVRRTRADGLAFRQVTRDPRGDWQLVKTYVTDPRRSAVLIRVRLVALDGRPHPLYVLVDPALSNGEMDDRGATRRGALLAWDRDAALAVRAQPPLVASASGYAGRLEPWRRLQRGALTRTDARRPGNVRQLGVTSLTGLPGSRAMTLALGFGAAPRAAQRTAARSLGSGFAATARSYAEGWRDYLRSLEPVPDSAAGVRRAYLASLLVLAAAEDKRNRGAHIASPSMPWAWGLGTIERDLPSGPYHLVWARDLYQSATAQIAAGDTAAAMRGLDFLLFRQQRADGSFPQNSTVTGEQRWSNTQLDEVALPIVLAWQLQAWDRSRWERLRLAAEYLVARGPVTPQERWENQEGYSPATIAAEIAGLVCAADIARRNADPAAAARYEATADAWAANVASWTVTPNGPYTPRPYYLRITKDGRPDLGTTYRIGDGGPSRADQRSVVDPSFLELVRLGVVRADDPVIRNTVQVVDAQLRVAAPQGDLFHRFSFDGYGERRDGGPWDLSPDDSGRTLGRLWPLLSGERGEYELLAGRSADAQLRALAESANDGDLLPEQVWDGRPPTGSRGARLGEGTRSATPLSWAHAQLVRLAWSIEARRPVEQPRIVACRYAGCP
jgi:glucoamylase